MNKCVIIGRWVKDCDLRFTGNKGTAVLSGVLAIDRQFKKEDGTKETDFIPVIVWGKQAESVATYSGKGKLISIAGRIETRNYDNKEGKKVYVTEVIAEEVQFIEWAEKPQKAEQIEQIEEVLEDGDCPF